MTPIRSVDIPALLEEYEEVWTPEGSRYWKEAPRCHCGEDTGIRCEGPISTNVPQECPACSEVLPEEDAYDLMSEDARRAVVQMVLAAGRHLDSKSEWSMEDNFTTTEEVADVYQAHIKPVIGVPERPSLNLPEGPEKEKAAEKEKVTFAWSLEHGRCYDCGIPAAFYLPRAYVRKGDPEGPTDFNKRCAICAANDAALGEQVRRIDAFDEELGDEARDKLVEHLQTAHGYRPSETDPDPETARSGKPGTFGLVRLTHPVWTLESLEHLHADDHSNYPDTGTPVKGQSHSHPKEA
jgi:hypothetical protein